MGLEKEIKSYLKDHHTVRRYNHILGVKKTAGKLAEKWWIPEDSGYTLNGKPDRNKRRKKRIYKSRRKFTEDTELAALLHDLDKSSDTEDMWDNIKNDKSLPSKVKSKIQDSREVWHGFSGAVRAKNNFRVKDKDILNSVRYHTTGRSRMSLMEKIIYLADYIEPGRTTPGLTKIREEAYRDIDSACLMVADATIEYVKSKSSVSSLSYDFKKSLEKKLKNKIRNKSGNKIRKKKSE